MSNLSSHKHLLFIGIIVFTSCQKKPNTNEIESQEKPTAEMVQTPFGLVAAGDVITITQAR